MSFTKYSFGVVAAAAFLSFIIVGGCGVEWFPDTRQPDPFTFANKNTTTNTVTESDGVQMSHNTTGSDVSVSSNSEWATSNDNKTYSTFTKEPGRIVAGQWLKVRHTSSASVEASTVTTVHVQDYTTTFTSFTIGQGQSTSGKRLVTPVYDSTGKFAASEASGSRDATTGKVTMNVNVANTSTEEATVTVQVQPKKSDGTVVDIFNASGKVPTSGAKLSDSKEMDADSYNSIAKWEITKVTKETAQ